MAPIVLLDAPGSGYWEAWSRFVHELSERSMISPHDMHLFKAFSDVDSACNEILHFYSGYHSQRYVGGHLVLRLKKDPSPALVTEINQRFGDIIAAGAIERIDATPQEVADGDVPELPRLRFHYIRRSVGRLRLMIDHLNDSMA